MWRQGGEEGGEGEGQRLFGGGIENNRWRKTVLFIFLGWNMLLFLLVVIALAKVGKIHDETGGNDAGSGSGSGDNFQIGANFDVSDKSASLSLFKSSSFPSEVSVSLDSDGKVLLGGGSTIYQNVATIPQIANNSNSISYLSTIPLDSNKVLLAFKDDVASTCVMAVGILDDDSTPKFHLLSQIQVQTCAINLISLTDSLFITQRYGYIASYTVDNDVITPVQNVTFSEIGPGSSVAALSKSTFAVTYFAPNENATAYELVTSVVKVADDSISIVTTLSFAPDVPTQSLLALSSSSYLCCYPELVSSSLTCSLFNFDGTTISLIATEAFPSTNTSFFFDLTFLSSKSSVYTAALVWIEESRNNRLQAVIIQVSGNTITFGSSIILNSGDASGALSSGDYPGMSVQTISDHQFVVMYSDFANGGRTTLNLVGLNDDAQLYSPTSSFDVVVIASPPNTNESGYYWLSLAVLNKNQFLLFDSLSGGASSTGSQGGVHLAEVMNKPLGVSTNNQPSGGDSADIIVSGVMTVSSAIKLKTGMTYYSTTKGDLIAGPEYGSRSVSAMNYLQNGNLLLSADSCIGTALGQHTLLLHVC